MERLILRGSTLGVWVVSLAIAVVTSSPTANAYTPESREVKAALAKASNYLIANYKEDTRVGAQALVGLVLVKQGTPASHPVVVDAINVCRRAAASVGGRRVSRPRNDEESAGSETDGMSGELDIYSLSIAIIFLTTVDPGQNGPPITDLLNRLLQLQKPTGGWGYPERDTGDTSMTQNVVLALWEVKMAGFTVPVRVLDDVTYWQLKTQDPSGAFGYQGIVSPDFSLVKQTDIRHSMVAAGLGSLFVLSDALGLEKQKKDDGLAPALREIKRDAPQQFESRVDARLVRDAIARGNRWFQANYTITGRPIWNNYYLYALERYCFFREKDEGQIEKEPGWYNDGVRHLLKIQQQDGSWAERLGIVPNTAFGCLFLMRSTEKAFKRVQSYGDGTLIGGRGLPSHTTGVTVLGGKVVAKPKLGMLEKMLDAIDDPRDPDYTEVLEALAELPAVEAGSLVSKHAEMLKQLAGGASPDARLAAVRALAKSNNVDHVPILIYALTDPDPVIMRSARDGLRRISRKFKGFGMPDEPSDVERHAAVRNWQAWYLAIRPDAEFED